MFFKYSSKFVYLRGNLQADSLHYYYSIRMGSLYSIVTLELYRSIRPTKDKTNHEIANNITVCTAAVLNFPPNRNFFLKIKELCHIANTKPEQIPLKF